MQCLINSCFTKNFWGEIQCSPVSWYVSYRGLCIVMCIVTLLVIHGTSGYTVPGRCFTVENERDGQQQQNSGDCNNRKSSKVFNSVHVQKWSILWLVKAISVDLLAPLTGHLISELLHITTNVIKYSQFQVHLYQIKHAFSSTHRTLHFESVPKCDRSNVIFCRNVATGLFLQLTWIVFVQCLMV